MGVRELVNAFLALEVEIKLLAAEQKQLEDQDPYIGGFHQLPGGPDRQRYNAIKLLIREKIHKQWDIEQEIGKSLVDKFLKIDENRVATIFEDPEDGVPTIKILTILSE